MKLTKKLFFLGLLFIFQSNLNAQEKVTKSPVEEALSDFSFRSVGPAFMSGRIADIAIDQTNENVWYVAVGSGGLWKTSTLEQPGHHLQTRNLFIPQDV